MPKDFNESTSLERHLKLQWVDSNTSTITIRTLYVSNINTDCVQLFDSLFHTPPRANYNNCNSVCSPRSIIHLRRQVKLIGKSGELHWEDYQLKTTSAIDCWNGRLVSWIVFIVFMIDSDPQRERKLYSP